MGKKAGIGIGIGLLTFFLLYQEKQEQEAAVQVALIPGEINVVYYNQADEPWGSNYYDTRETKTQTIASGGCGPTTLAIVYDSLTGEEDTPADMADYAMENGYCAAPNGSYRSLFTTGAEGLGLTSEYAGEDLTEALPYLSEGCLIVSLMGEGIFCDGGHFVVIRAITDDGYIQVADCWNAANNSKNFDFDTIDENLKKDGGNCLWVLSYEAEEEE